MCHIDKFRTEERLSNRNSSELRKEKCGTENPNAEMIDICQLHLQRTSVSNIVFENAIN